MSVSAPSLCPRNQSVTLKAARGGHKQSMSATIIISLSELIAADARMRLKPALASRATVVVQCAEDARLPVAVVYAVLEATAETSGFLRFEGLSANARLALQVVDPDRRLAVGDAARSFGQVGDRPYQVRLAADGSVTLLLLKGIGQHHHMNETAAYEWIRGLEATAVIIDMSQIEHLNSLLVAWLLQMNQGAGVGRCRLVQVGRQAVTQLSQLRLNHLLVIG